MKGIINHEEAGFISEVNQSMSYTSQCNARKLPHMVILTDVEKAFDKIQHLKVGKGGSFINLMMNIYEEPIARLRLNSERQKTFPLR